MSWMKMAAGMAAFAVLGAVPGLAPRPAARAGDAPRAAVSEVMVLAGIDAALDQFPSLIQTQIEARRQDLAPEVAARLERALQDAFKPALLKGDAREMLAAHFQPEVFAEGLPWLRSPLGRRITQLEIDSGKDENQAALGEWVENLPQHPPPKDRIILVADVVRSTDTLTTVIEMIVLVAEPILQTLNAAADEAERRSQEELAVLLNAMRENLGDPIGRQLLLRGMYTYRDVSDADLTAYTAFLRSEAGGALYQALNAGMIAAMEQAGQRFGNSFPSVINP